MAELKIHIDEIIGNIKKLSNVFDKYNKKWSLITKVFSGDPEFLKRILTDDVIQGIHSVGDSRLTSLKNLKKTNPKMRTIYIKPPAKIYADDIVKYADISLNSSYETIKSLNEAAKKQNKIHEIIIMIELGELREGVKRDDIISFYKKVFNFPNIKVVGLGSNLGCMYGVEPTYDKLLQISLYKELIESKFDQKMNFVSGGSSITLPLLLNDSIPADMNHFRIGESAFFGTSPLDNKQFMDLSTDTFYFYANIIELEEKKIVPEGIISDASIGHTANFDKEDISGTTYKAILDFGLLDVDREEIEVKDENIKFVGITSDMTVVDIGNNRTADGKPKYKVGDKICFKPSYMGVARLLNSKFIDKIFV
ncbi:MAG: alanine racemase [Bacteroidales bacterium]|nr:alanine racemase [Bacteroidales bacterium]